MAEMGSIMKFFFDSQMSEAKPSESIRSYEAKPSVTNHIQRGVDRESNELVFILKFNIQMSLSEYMYFKGYDFISKINFCSYNGK